MNLAPRFLDTATVASLVSTNNYGDPTYGTKRAIAGRVMTELRKEFNASGTTIRTVSVFLTDQAILPTDRIWPPGADTSFDKTSRIVGLVTDARTLDGGYHLWKVDL